MVSKAVQKYGKSSKKKVVAPKGKKNGRKQKPEVKRGGDNFRKIWKIVFEGAKTFRFLYGKKFDGDRWWQDIATYLAKYDHIRVNMLRLPRRTRAPAFELAEFQIDGLGKTRMVELNHFIIQQMRIASKPGNVRKAVQLALYAGQLHGDMNFKDHESIPGLLE